MYTPYGPSATTPLCPFGNWLVPGIQSVTTIRPGRTGCSASSCARAISESGIRSPIVNPDPARLKPGVYITRCCSLYIVRLDKAADGGVEEPRKSSLYKTMRIFGPRSI
jgi:hypothetical protein